MILLDGMARSGTSLVGRLMNLLLEPAGFEYFYEPFHHPTPAGLFEGWKDSIRRILVPGDADPPLDEYLRHLESSAKSRNIFWKEIRLALKQDWLLARDPNLRIVHLTRDILGVWSSHRRPGAPDWMERHRAIWDAALVAWSFKRERLAAKGVPHLELLDRLDLLNDIERYALIWTLNESFVRILKSDRMIIARYETICSDPIPELTRIADFLKVEFPPQIRDAAIRHLAESEKEHDPSGKGTGLPPNAMPEIWKSRLSESEIEAILRIAGTTRAKCGYEI